MNFINGTFQFTIDVFCFDFFVIVAFVDFCNNSAKVSIYILLDWYSCKVRFTQKCDLNQ